MNALSDDIDSFLDKCRILIDKRQVDLFLNDPDNRQTMDLIQYSPRALMQELKELKPEDLHEGPVKDDNPLHEGYVWIFKKSICNRLLYIKIKIRIRNKEEVFLMSFHPDR